MNRDQLEEILRSNNTRDAEFILYGKVCWRPIVSAPTDGTEIMVWAKMFDFEGAPEGVYVVTWGETWTGCGTNATQIDAWRVSGTLDGNCDVWDRVYPTHWMPIPEKP